MRSFTDSVVSTPAPDIGGVGGVTETSRLPQYQNGIYVEQQTFEGPRAAMVSKINQLIQDTTVESIQCSESANGAKIAATVTYRAQESEWSVEPFEIGASLATHPYFQVAYIPESGHLIEEYIAQADAAIASGEYLSITAGDYAAWVRRYFALRQAGVEEYPRFGLSVRKRFKTADVNEITTYMALVGFVVTIPEMGCPPDTVAMLNAMRKIDAYGSAAPSSYSTVTAEWEFLQRVPRITGPDEGPWDVEFEWWGMDQWSSVLYPGGSWDPELHGDTGVVIT